MAQAELKFGQAEQDLVLRVAQAYFDVLSAAENFAAARFARESIRERLDAARTSVEVGVGRAPTFATPRPASNSPRPRKSLPMPNSRFAGGRSTPSSASGY